MRPSAVLRDARRASRWPMIPAHYTPKPPDCSFVKENPAAIFVGMATRLGSYALYIHVDSLILTSNLALMALWLYNHDIQNKCIKLNGG